MDKQKTIIGSVVLLLCVMAAWWFGLFGGTDSAIAKLQDLSGQMADSSLSDAQRDQLRDQFRDQMRSLSDAQRQTWFNSNRDQWQARSAQRMNEFFAASPADQRKQLDNDLDRMNRPRGNQQQNPNGANQNGGNQGGGNQSANGGRRGGGAGMTEAQREERAKRRLDNTSPKMRAQFAEYRRMLGKRAEERGVKAPNPWGRGI